MEDIGRTLRSCADWSHISESFLLAKFVNALPHEFDVQKQTMEEREGGLSRETVLSSVRKRYESPAL